MLEFQWKFSRTLVLKFNFFWMAIQEAICLKTNFFRLEIMQVDLIFPDPQMIPFSTFMEYKTNVLFNL